jgi:hypothetical protein
VALHRFTLLVDEPGPVFEWLRTQAGSALVRQRADDTVVGWTVRVALDADDAAARFAERWASDFHDAQIEPRRSRLHARARKAEQPDTLMLTKERLALLCPPA